MIIIVQVSTPTVSTRIQEQPETKAGLFIPHCPLEHWGGRYNFKDPAL